MRKREKLKLPILNDECPNCHCKETLPQQLIEDLKLEGVLHADSFKEGCAVLNVQMVDPKYPPPLPNVLLPNQPLTVKVPVMKIYLTVCKKCKAIYNNRFDLDYLDIPVQTISIPKPPLPGEN